jgi:hypothetical protein
MSHVPVSATRTELTQSVTELALRLQEGLFVGTCPVSATCTKVSRELRK